MINRQPSRDMGKLGKVLLTGHTGFKGTWATLLLQELGIEVVGLSLPAETGSLYDRLGRLGAIEEHFFDIADRQSVADLLETSDIQTVIHMAAQPLVLLSYKNPTKTFETNVLGTVNVLDACFSSVSVKSIVVVTTDKVYENKNIGKRFVETDSLAGKDPYSASKVGTEAAVAAWSQISKVSGGPTVISVRAGNVIGGGDFAEDRIVPDFFKSLKCKKKLIVRNPEATRPWQNVLDSLFGYLILLYRLNTFNNFKNFPKSWNFGPMSNSEKNIKELINSLQKINKKKIRIFYMKKKQLNKKESKFLRLNSSQAKKYLNWRPIFNFNQNISFVNSWYINYINKRNMIDYSLKQIDFYFKKLFKRFN